MNHGILFAKTSHFASIAAASVALLLATSAPHGTISAAAEVEVNAGETITVNTLDDISDFSGSHKVSDLPGSDGLVSFREAVTAANHTPGPQTIVFAIPPSTFWRDSTVALLRLQEGAFILDDSGTTVDFSSQTANMGDTNPSGPEVGIYGVDPNGFGAAAIFVNGDDCVIKGLGKVYQRGYALRITGDRNRVIGSQISGPLLAAVSIGGDIGGATPSGNIVGGTEPGEGNALIGLRIDAPAEGNIVIGNSLLVDVQVRGATEGGAFVHNTRIGGPSPAERNVISGAGFYGEEGYPVGAQISVLDADGTLIEGNYIGTTADGMRAYPQTGQSGIEVRDSRETTVRGNVIAGLRVAGVNHYAGLIFGQAIYLNAANADIVNTRIENNTIGLAADQLTPITTRAGITVSPTRSIYHVTGTTIASNHIAAVETTGIFVNGLEDGVTITANSIHDCGGLGIDLAASSTIADGPNGNDLGDGDSGGNHLQNFPVLQSASTSGSAITIQGALDTSRSAEFKIELFASPTCNPSGFGEGATFLGSTTASTDNSGHADFSVTLQASVGPGARITATATRLSDGDTSEFSACIVAGKSVAPTVGRRRSV